MNATDRVFSIVLAAGSSSRFGETKQLADYRGSTLVRHAMRLAEAVCDSRSILVTGHDARRVAKSCQPLSGFIVHNESFGNGLGSSLASGVAASMHIADAVLVMLADQPLVTANHLRTLVAYWNDAPDRIIASRYAGTPGPPAVFPRSYFPVLAALDGDSGARKIISDNVQQVTMIDFENAAKDIDTPGDLAALE